MYLFFFLILSYNVLTCPFLYTKKVRPLTGNFMGFSMIIITLKMIIIIIVAIIIIIIIIMSFLLCFLHISVQLPAWCDICIKNTNTVAALSKADRMLDLSDTLYMGLNLTDVSVWMCVHVLSYCVARGRAVHQFLAQGVILHV